MPQAPCRLTDGRFDADFRPTACATPRCTEPPHHAAIVDLGRAERVDLIVVRGCRDRCTVETSTNGRTWRLAGVASADPADVSISSPRPARYVRVTGSTSVDRLTEVSAWAGRPALPDASLLVTPRAFPTTGGAKGGAPRATDPDDDDGLGAWPLVATGLLGAAVGGLLVTIARRRRSAA